MSKKLGPNQPCPCGSGRKFKKCCGGPEAQAAQPGSYTQEDRANAMEALDAFIEEVLVEEEEESFGVFWGRHAEREGQLPEHLLLMSRDVQETWFACDYRLDDGETAIGIFLREAERPRGERAFLETLARSSMRLYEVIAKVPGSSLTLRDVLEGSVVTVSERTASRTLTHHACLAARVVARGASGKPEVERGILPIPELLRQQVIAQVRSERDAFVREHSGSSIDEFYADVPPMLHDVWIRAIFEPAVPRLTNNDGEELVATRMEFDVADHAAVVAALDGAAGEGLTRAGDGTWHWVAAAAMGGEVALANVTLGESRLSVETNSVARGARARELVERVAGEAIRHRGTVHEDLQRVLRERLTARALGEEGDEADDGPARPGAGGPDGLPPEIAEALVMQHYARHYRAWIDEPVPALDGRTPRDAARDTALRSRVEELIQGIEALYERALREGAPAYDPSWMWAELGLESGDVASQPPPLAHERVAERVPGSAEICQAVATRLRAQPSFSDAETTIDDDELRGDLELQRWLRRDTSRDDAGVPVEPGGDPAAAAPYLEAMINLELHRRKVFWVDPALSYMLEQTDLDIAGRELRAPFASCALVFTDRHALSLGERYLSRRDGEPLRGQILRVITVYVTARELGDRRALELVLALDALGADLPALARHTVPCEEGSLRSFLDGVAPRASIDAVAADASPLRGLLRLALNALLYATSAGVAPETRTVSRPPRGTGPARTPPRSESIYYLPGTIDIRRVRQLQELARAPDGRATMARFMVRGHWRRAAKQWADQRLRWIEPYWKGPDLAAVIEKAYRLRP